MELSPDRPQEQLPHMPRSGKSETERALRNGHYEAVSTTIFANLLVGPYLTGYLLYLGASAGQVGFITALPLLMNAAIVMISAFLMEKFTNRYRIAMVALLFHRGLLCACGLIPFLVPSDWQVTAFTVLFVVLCLCGSISSAPFTTLFADMVPPDRRARYFGMRFTLTGVAASVTLLAAGSGLDRVSQARGFAWLFILGTVAAVINMFYLFRYPNIPYKPTGSGLSLQVLVRPFRDRGFIRSILFVSFWIMAQGSTISLFSYVMLDIMKINYEWVGISNTLLAIVSIAAYAVWGKLNTKWSNRQLLLWVFPLNAVSVILWGLQVALPVNAMLLVVYTFLGISMAGFGLLVFNFVMSDTPEKDRPMYYAVYASMTGLFGFLGPFLGGQLFQVMKAWPKWFQAYGFFVSTGLVMLLASLTLSFRIFGEKK
ncbi:MFS transporter [Paenibacillus sp. HJGM_3]|uniref:MFS transporter n=1 Tax=Paenibacillus sp. HJGM_3 TaxID=3379816 RepID=UPI00385863A9